jgi:PTS system galactitol-specific IIA component
MTFDLTDLLHVELIDPSLEAATKEDAIVMLSQRLRDQGFVNDGFAQAVLDREKEFPTGLPTKDFQIAIPHTDIEHVSHSALAIAVLKEPVKFRVMGSPKDEVEAKIIFLLAISDHNLQVKALSQLATIFQKGPTLKTIAKATSAEEIIEAMQSAAVGEDHIEHIEE